MKVSASLVAVAATVVSAELQPIIMKVFAALSRSEIEPNLMISLGHQALL